MEFSEVRIKSIKNVKSETEKTFVDITVEDNHTFFIVSDAGTKYLMHNCDGSHILTLLVNFFYNWPELFANGIIKYVRTPLWICTKNKDVQYFYTDEEFEQKRNSLKGYEIRYIKGLGSLRNHEYTFAINNQSMWQTITIDDASAIRTMFSGEAVSERKEILKNG